MATELDKASLESQTSSGGRFVRRSVIGTYVSVCTYQSAARAVLDWAKEGGTWATSHVNTHGAVVASQHKEHQEAMNACDLVTPDGWPVAKFLKKLGESIEERVTGPELMEHICALAAAENVPIGLYGGKQETLKALEAALVSRNLKLRVTYNYSPPFRPPTDEELLAEDEAMKASGARIFFIGLGCPKQELYVHQKKMRGVPGVFMAVGAAIDINSGTQKKCPTWMKKHGFEWLFRLLQDPKRLWKRYATYPYQFYRLTQKQLRSRNP